MIFYIENCFLRLKKTTNDKHQDKVTGLERVTGLSRPVCERNSKDSMDV